MPNMSGTIETTDAIIRNKLSCLEEILSIFDKCGMYVNSHYGNELRLLKDAYEMGSMKIISDYFLLMNTYQNSLPGQQKMSKSEFNAERKRHFTDYELFVRKDNYGNKIDRICAYAKKQFQVHDATIQDPTDRNNIKFWFDQYANATLNKQITAVKYNLCTQCNKPMKILSNMSDLLCVQCGLIENLYGTVFEDEQFYYQEGQRTKHGSYAPSKHCKVWVERIQARESTEIPQKLIDDLKAIISDELTNINDVTCKIIRKYLQQLHRSKYNEHVPLIRKIITGESPDQLTCRESQLINIYFDKVLKIYDNIKPADKSNCFYHPYFIYKIIEHILKDDPKERLESILSCIHLQSRDTLIKNDRIWQKICDQLPDVEYIPTYKT